jgi:hypothetical protein
VSRLHPDLESLRENQSTDYNTGRQKIYADVNLTTDRLPHEPHSIRAMAEQVNGRDWMVRVVHGPHEERDKTGSYYNTVATDIISGVTPSKVKTHVRRAVKSAHSDLLKQRPS